MRKVVEHTDPAGLISLSNISHARTYAVQHDNNVYKLHNIGGQYAFVILGATICTRGGVFGNMRDAVEALMQVHDVYEFNTAKEFLMWALAQQK